MSDQPVGTVARILSEREVVLSRGVKDGVKVGDYVGIIDKEASEVADPTTGKEIGQLVHFKISLRVTQASDALSIASTYQVQRVNRGGYGTLNPMRDFTKMMQDPHYVDEVETMRVNVEDLPSGDFDAAVEVGDEFRVVSKEVADSGYML